MNWGLSSKLKSAFSNIVPVPRPSVVDQEIKDPNWVAGFTCGEGSFMIDIIKSKTTKLGSTAGLRFTLTQHSRDKQLLLDIMAYLNCGHLNTKNINCFDLTVRRFKDIKTKIIPFFIRYPIIGCKLLDFKDFCDVEKLITNKDHLTIEGVKKISDIKRRNDYNT